MIIRGYFGPQELRTKDVYARRCDGVYDNDVVWCFVGGGRVNRDLLPEDIIVIL